MERLQESQANVRQDDERRRHVEAVALRMTKAPYDPAALGEAAIEGALEALVFERGFIWLARAEEAAGDDPDGMGIEILASRTRRGGGGEWQSVRNADFAVNRSVIKRAVAGGQTIAMDDCLVQPAPDGEESHRAVLCQPFEIAPRWSGVLYLDRTLGGGEIGEDDAHWLQEFSLRCAPLVARALLAAEAEDLRAQLEAAGSGASAAEDPLPEAEDLLPEGGPPSFHGIIGSDEKLLKILRIIDKVKDSDLNTCIFGESGTGKELLARVIHDSSIRRDKLFVAENCGAIPENLLESELFGHMKGAFTGADDDKKGLFELADGGTLFLDEIGDMSELMQKKLLRVLQEGLIRPIGGKGTVKVKVRVVCASNRDLKHLVQQGTFRADLYYRLNVITIEIPPLRERPGDIPLLVRHFVSEVCREEDLKKRLTASAMNALCKYPWPGNVRELRNVIRRALLTCPGRLVARKDVAGLLSPANASPRSGENIDRDDKDLILRVPVRESFNEIVEECERVILLNALNQHSWNKSKVTKALRIPRQSLYNKIARYKLERTWGEGAADMEARD